MPAWLSSLSSFLIILTMVVGQLGLIIPIFPGNVVIWAASLVYGIIFGFGKLGGILFGVITLLMLSRARNRAMARPSPRLPPVMSAVLEEGGWGDMRPPDGSGVHGFLYIGYILTALC